MGSQVGGALYEQKVISGAIIANMNAEMERLPDMNSISDLERLPYTCKGFGAAALVRVILPCCLPVGPPVDWRANDA